jgi:hypothetical protein
LVRYTAHRHDRGRLEIGYPEEIAFVGVGFRRHREGDVAEVEPLVLGGVEQQGEAFHRNPEVRVPRLDLKVAIAVGVAGARLEARRSVVDGEGLDQLVAQLPGLQGARWRDREALAEQEQPDGGKYPKRSQKGASRFQTPEK